MAIFSSLNNAIASGNNGKENIFQTKELLVSAGWTIHGSCDGTTTSYVADVCTTAAKISALNAWIVVEDPSASWQMLFGHRTGAENPEYWHVSYSRGALFDATGDETAYPVAADSGDLCYSSASIGTLFVYSEASYLNVWADSSTGAFYSLTTAQGTGAARTLIYYDPLAGGVGGDTDQAVVAALYSSGDCVSASGLYSSNNSTNNIAEPHAWFDLTGTPTFQGCGAQALSCNGAPLLPYIAAGAGVNNDDGKDPAIPVIYGKSSASTGGAPYGVKGYSSIFQMLGTNRAAGSTLTQAASKDRVVWGTYRTSLPWVGPATPLV